MRMYTEEELEFARVESVGSIAMLKRVRTLEPYNAWYIVDQIELCEGYRKRTTRTYNGFIAANEYYQKRLELMKEKGVSK